MATSIGAGGSAFVSTSLRAFPGADNLQAGENKQISGNAALQRQDSLKESASARPVEESGNSSKARGADGEELTESEEKQVRELKKRDAEVKAHEQAHATVGGSYASAPSYEYTVGPDGKRYATSGEVQIDASPVRDNPEATIRKMDIVIRAALAPAEPSSQDLQVAKQAQATRAQAQSELLKKRQEEQSGKSEPENKALQSVTSQQENSKEQDAIAAYQTAENIFSAAAQSQNIFSLVA